MVPDLLATITSVLAGLSPASAAATASGSVESQTRIFSHSLIEANAVASTSGAREDPPIPATIAVVNPASRTFSPNASSAGTCSVKCTGASSQPSRFAIFACTSASRLQSVTSLSASRVAHSSVRARSKTALIAARSEARLTRAEKGSRSSPLTPVPSQSAAPCWCGGRIARHHLVWR